MKILILNKREFNKFMEYNMINDDNVEEQDMLIVSINQPCESHIIMGRSGVYSHFSRQHSNVMIMHFMDVGENYINNFEELNGVCYQFFNKYKAKKLYEFIKRNKDKKLAVLHCSAGISRSGAVGTFIYDMYGKDTMTWEEFQRKNPYIHPNEHILKLLHEEQRNDT
jgi:predicted protein tyrosine phosphatase